MKKNGMKNRLWKRGERWYTVVDVGRWPAQRCPTCGKGALWWVNGHRLEACPKCGGDLQDVQRRRQLWQAFDTQAEARSARDKKAVQVREKDYRPPSDLTLSEYLAEWFDRARKVTRKGQQMTPTCEADYHYKIKRITGRIGAVKLSNLTDADVTRVRDELIERKLAPKTVAGTLALLGQALRPAVRAGTLKFNPADPDVVNRPTNGHDTERAVMTPELAAKILDAANEAPLFQAAVALALGSSLRREEVLGLRWSDVDLDAGTAKVEQTVTVVGKAIRGDRDAIHTGPPKTANSRRKVPLDPRAVEILRFYQIWQGERREAAGTAWEEHGLVVDRGDGRPWNPSTFTSAWRDWAKKNGLKGETERGETKQVTFHSLRAGFSTLGGAAGQSARSLADVMGHTDSRFTERVYQDVLMDRKREAVAGVWDLMRPKDS